ncbi:MAG TPA: methionine adenosyltransferase [Solirubrobacterales bacterium]|nr:methionine adenosyltransferase [Solirubrobacterales bacterium]
MISIKPYAPALATSNSHLFTSESVTGGHPDKVCDRLSDTMLDAALAMDPDSRVAIEVFVTSDYVVIGGEIRTKAIIDYDKLARHALNEIGYDGFDPRFAADSVEIQIKVNQQSPDIAQGVEAAAEVRERGSSDEIDNAGAGDQGMMFGYAVDETDELMPMPIWYAHRLADQLTAVRQDGTVPYLRPDGKTQVTMRYEDGKPVEIVALLISAHHAPGIDRDRRLRMDLIEHVIEPVLPEGMYDRRQLFESLLVNPTGIFEIGGPVADAGLTGRKIIVDTYGGAARHGGGAFSGKDPSKVDRSGAYAARWVAKNVVAAGLATRCEIQVAYAIGVARPVSVMVETFDTEKVPTARIEELVNEHFDLRPLAFRRELDLHRPIYSKTAAGGHFGRTDADFTWERTDKAEAMRQAALASSAADAFGQVE